MPDSFDPYHKWLGIAPKDQPPNHYRLLAIDLYESDPEVIEAAAARWMSYIKSCGAGPRAADARKLLVEIAAARRCLLDARQRSTYDASLAAPPPASTATKPAVAKTAAPKKLARARPLAAVEPVATRSQPAKPVVNDTPPEGESFVDTGAVIETASAESSHTTAKKPRRGSRSKPQQPAWLMFATLGVALAGLIGGGIWYFNQDGSKTAKERDAAKKSSKDNDAPPENTAEERATNDAQKPIAKIPGSKQTVNGATSAESESDEEEQPADDAATAPSVVGRAKQSAIFDLITSGGTPKALKDLIAGGGKVDERDAQGRTGLRVAATLGKVDLVKALLAADADPNAADSSGATPLMSAAQRGDNEIVAMLLEAKANPNARTRSGSEGAGLTALLIAARYGHTDSEGKSDVIEALLDAGAKSELANEEGVTPLMVAAWQGHLEAVQALLVKGSAKADAVDREGQTTIMFAAQSGKPQLIQILADRGAKLDATSHSGATALAIATAKRDEAMVKRIKEVAKNAAPDIDF